MILTTVEILHMQVNNVIIIKIKEKWEKIESTDQYDTKSYLLSLIWHSSLNIP